MNQQSNKVKKLILRMIWILMLCSVMPGSLMPGDVSAQLQIEGLDRKLCHKKKKNIQKYTSPPLCTRTPMPAKSKKSKKTQKKEQKKQLKQTDRLKNQMMEFFKFNVQLSMENLVKTQWISFSGDDFYETNIDRVPWLSFHFLDDLHVDITSFSQKHLSSGYTYKIVNPDTILIQSAGDPKRVRFRLRMIGPSTMIVTKMYTAQSKTIGGAVFGMLHKIIYS